MYTKSIPFHDFYGKPRNQTVHYNLTEGQFFKLFKEFKIILEWRDSLKGEERMLDSFEVVEFYTALEEIMLSAYGVPSEDGLYFDNDGRYQYEKSALHNAVMMMFLSDPVEANKMVDALMPKGMEELIRKASDNLEKVQNDPSTEAELQAEIARLRALVPATSTAPAVE